MKGGGLNKILIAIIIALLSCCCKKHVTYTVSEYGKSWISSYQNSSAIFKNETDSEIVYAYSEPQGLYGALDYECSDGDNSDASGEYLTMQLKSNQLPINFEIGLYAYTKDDYGSIQEHLTISNTNCYGSFSLYFENDTVTSSGNYIYLNSVSIGNSTFYHVYTSSNFSNQCDSNNVLSFYFTKQQGIVAFKTDSATWVLQN